MTAPVQDLHVIVLAQGQQARLPELKQPKQLLALPACDGVPILRRTLRQLATIIASRHLSSTITVVGTFEVCDWMTKRYTLDVSDFAPTYRMWCPSTPTARGPTAISLVEPGNSSVKGLARTLEARWQYMREERRGAHVGGGVWPQDLPIATVVLLGDVVYSHACLQALIPRAVPHSSAFAVTGDLSQSTGELWGFTWADRVVAMEYYLANVLKRHPPFEAYQPGQLRQVLFEIEALGRPAGRIEIDDYTRDIDLPEHVKLLGRLSEQAAADDHANGMGWT